MHINAFKKKEFTTYMLIHLLNQLKECKEPTHAFSLWILLQFIDFKLLQDKVVMFCFNKIYLIIKHKKFQIDIT